MEWKPFVLDAPLDDGLGRTSTGGLGGGRTTGGGGGGGADSAAHKVRSDRDAVLFLVDCQKSMFEPKVDKGTGETSTPFSNALRCVIQFMHDKVFASERDLVGLMFYGTEQKLNHFDFPGIFMFHGMDMPSATRIQELEIVASSAKDKAQYDEFVRCVGHCPKPFPLSEAFWAALHTFHHIASKGIGFRRIFIFTDDDNPPQTDNIERTKCLTRARDLVEADILLEVFAFRRGVDSGIKAEPLSLSPPSMKSATKGTGSGGGSGHVPSSLLSTLIGHASGGEHRRHSPPIPETTSVPAVASATVKPSSHSPARPEIEDDGTPPFNATVFWDHIVFSPEDSYTGSVHVNCSETFSAMLSDVKRRIFTKRAVASFSIRMGPSKHAPQMCVQMYNPLMRAGRPKHSWLEAATNAPLVSESKRVCRGTGAELSEADVVRVADYGGCTVAFSSKELREMSTQFGSSELQILCFVQQSWLKPKYNIGHSAFLYPNEGVGKGSTKMFAALVRSMTAQAKIGIGQLVPRSGASPRLCALLPSEEQMDMDGNQVSPPGLWVVNLPYADDYRSLSFEATTKPEDDLVDMAKRVIRRISADFPRDGVPNPALQWHYTMLQNLAVGEEMRDDQVPVDMTLPDFEGMMKHKKALDAFQNAVFSADYNADNVAGVTAYDPLAKKPKLDISTIDFVALYNANQLDTLTLPPLKQFLKDRDESLSGLKKDIVQRVRDIIAAELKKSPVKGGEVKEESQA
eukprot:PhM_4_TR9502/c0_g1_i2/m.6574/K10884/XRCC6, KU70, G22P1; ATP-dependent DNA helicase 2 subunit 1